MELLVGNDVQPSIDYLQRLDGQFAAVASGAYHDNLLAKNEYLQLVEATELFLSQAFLGAEWADRLLSERYWRIREMDAETARPWPLLSDEVKRLRTWLGEIISDLRHLQLEDAAADLTAARVVLDTNVFLHYKPYSDIHWPDVLGAKSIRLIILMAVIRELDDKKNVAVAPLGSRARKSLRMLHGHLHAEDGPVPVRTGVTVEVLRDPRRHVRQASVDQEILVRSESLGRRRGGQLFIVTGDLSMRLQAHAHNLAAVMLPDDLRLPEPGATATSGDAT